MDDEPFKTFAFEYDFDGQLWSIHIKAATLGEAIRRMHRMPMARPLGEVMFRVPAGGGWFAKAVCWIRNFASTGAQQK